MIEFDVGIIGGGPGGYMSALRLAEEGKKVVLFEKNKLGGVCLNEGCIPTKTLLQTSKTMELLSHAKDFGISVENYKADHKAVLLRKGRVIRKLGGGIKLQLKNAGVEVVNGNASIVSNSPEGVQLNCLEKEYLVKDLIIATGSSPFIPNILGAENAYNNGYVVTSTELLDIQEIPESLVIIGGGVIGLEMGAYFGAMGSQVTVIEMLEQIGGVIDCSLSQTLKTSLEKKGITFCLGCKVTEITNDGVKYENQEGEQFVSAQKVLLCVGRRPNISGLGLENVGVSVNRGAIVTDNKLRTNIEHIYAIGDVNGKVMLAHTAYREGEVVVNCIANREDCMVYDYIPSVIYTNPEVACVGLTEQEAKNREIPYKSVTMSLTYSGRYVAENYTQDGYVKIIANQSGDKILGVHVIGSYAGEYITTAEMFIKDNMNVEEIKKIIFPHPTVCEVVREAIFEL